jgi:integrase
MTNKPKQNKKAFFYPPEYEEVYNGMNSNGKYTLKFMINTGARINEVRGFAKNPIFDGLRHNITLTETKVRAKLGEKRPSPRTIPISKKFYRELRNEFDKKRILSTNAFNIQLRNSCKKSKIKSFDQFSSHNIRKTFGTWMLSLGVDGFKLAQHLGHTPNELARDYATNDVFNLKDKQIMRKILGDLPERIG